MKLNDNVKVVFKDSKENVLSIIISVNQLLEYTKEDLYDLLEESTPCKSSSCNNESQNFCDCDPLYEEYEVFEILTYGGNKWHIMN